MSTPTSFKFTKATQSSWTPNKEEVAANLHRHSNHDVLSSKCFRQLLLFILLQEDQNRRPAFCWIEAAIQGFLQAEQVDRNFLIKIVQKGNGQEGGFGNQSGFYPRKRCFFLCQRRPGEQALTLHQNTGPWVNQVSKQGSRMGKQCFCRLSSSLVTE